MSQVLLRSLRWLTFLFLLTPIVVVIVSSLSGSAFMSFPPREFSFASYRAISPDYIKSLYLSLAVAGLATLISVILGVPAALALSRGQFPGKGVVNAICLSPLTVPALVIGVGLYQFSITVWDYTGLTLGGTIYGLVLGHLSFGIPFVIRSVIAADARTDHAIEEAARNLGAGPLGTFFGVTLPLLRPGVVSGSIFAFLASFDDVPIALMLGGGDATTLPVRIFTAIEISFGGEVMAIAALIILASIVLMVALERTVGLENFFGARH
jgi:putative spermidine/putrescine transport system permease protein